MPSETAKSFERLIDFWKVKGFNYIGWVFNNLDFEKELPDEIEFDKIIVDDWLLESGLKEETGATVLIKYDF